MAEQLVKEGESGKPVVALKGPVIDTLVRHSLGLADAREELPGAVEFGLGGLVVHIDRASGEALGFDMPEGA